MSKDHYAAEGIEVEEKPDDLELIDADFLKGNFGSIGNNVVENSFAESSVTLPIEADMIAIADDMYATDVEDELTSIKHQRMTKSKVEISSVSDILKILQEKVDDSKQFFIITRRQVPLC